MATVTPTQTLPAPGGSAASSSYQLTIWTPIGDSDTCTAVAVPGYTEHSVQVTGTFSSATVIIQGSNNNTDFVTLLDTAGNAISMTATGLKAIAHAPLYIRPSSSGGSSSATVVTLVSRR